MIQLENEIKNNYLVAIVRIEGIGKTTTEKLFIKKIKSNYVMTWMINAENEANLDEDFSELLIQFRRKKNVMMKIKLIMH